MEAGWGTTGDLEQTFSEVAPICGTVTLDVSGDFEVLTVRALGIVPFEKVSVVGGIGYYDADLNGTASMTGLGSFEPEGSDDGATLGSGLEFNLERGNIRAELERFDTDDEVSAWDSSVGVLVHIKQGMDGAGRTASAPARSRALRTRPRGARARRVPS